MDAATAHQHSQATRVQAWWRMTVLRRAYVEAVRRYSSPPPPPPRCLHTAATGSFSVPVTVLFFSTRGGGVHSRRGLSMCFPACRAAGAVAADEGGGECRRGAGAPPPAYAARLQSCC
jgi:hypothetical protein